MIGVIDDVLKYGSKEKKRKSEDKVRYEKDNYIVSVRKQFRDEKGNVLFKKNWIVTAFESTRKEHEKKRTQEESNTKWEEIFSEKRRTSPRGTLTAPPSNLGAGGVTLPPSDVSSVGKDKNNISNTQEKREINSNKIYRQYTKEEIKEKIGDKLTNSNYHLIRQINPLLSVLFSSKVPEQLPYRDVFKTPTLEDYYIGTKAKFTSIGAEPAGTDYQSLTNAEKENARLWEEMKASGKYEWHPSPKSESEYLIDTKF